MKKGFTIIELLVAVVLLTILVWGIFAILNIADATLNTDTGLIDLQQQVRQGLDGMIKELRNSGAVTVLNSGGRIEFIIPTSIGGPSSKVISYYLDGNQIKREHPENTVKVLANDINYLSFCCGHYDALGNYICDTDCSNSKMIQIQVSASKTVRQRVLVFPSNGGVLTEKARLRNAS